MRQHFIITYFFILPTFALAQKQIRQIEINPFVRFDKYPQFSYVLGGRPNTDYVNIKGTSFGINVTYKIPIANSFFLRPGIGYYKYSFSDIKRENTSFGKSNSRDINFVSPLLFPFYTDKYWYNSVAANFGFEKVFFLKDNFQIITGLNINNFFTFSQYYHLTLNPNPDKNQDYKKKEKGYFGSSATLNINFVKKFKQISIGPSLILPVFDTWKTDATFQEETNSGTRSKWFKGIGFGISCNYSLTKN